MSTNSRRSVRDDSVAVEGPLPQDDFADEVLVTELEPATNGRKRALIFPPDAPSHRMATEWIGVDAGALVDLEDAR